jgi:25S rRNA (uracil2634-N3)-methyltransferase
VVVLLPMVVIFEDILKCQYHARHCFPTCSFSRCLLLSFDRDSCLCPICGSPGELRAVIYSRLSAGRCSSSLFYIPQNIQRLYAKNGKFAYHYTGDFSFALSLATHHGCKSILATGYDSEKTVYEKYPKAKQNIDRLIASGHPPPKSLKRKREDDDEDDANGGSSEPVDGKGPENDPNPHDEREDVGNDSQDMKSNGNDTAPRPPMNSQGPKVLFSVDAKKLGAGVVGGGKEIRNGFPRAGNSKLDKTRRPLPSQESSAPSAGKRGGEGAGMVSGGPWDIICFNFPHVGGLSTDVNRQVRSNQELLVSFFKTCVPLLSIPDPNADKQPEDGFLSSSEDDDEYEYGEDEDEDENGNREDQKKNKNKHTLRTEPGQILVTIFEGEPYTLWNIRDLARHAGLRVVQSFKFPWSNYPGYAHARTLGDIEAKKGGGRGGWKGDERDARTFIFEAKDVEVDSGVAAGGSSAKKGSGKAAGKGKGKRKREDDGGDSSDG